MGKIKKKITRKEWITVHMTLIKTNNGKFNYDDMEEVVDIIKLSIENEEKYIARGVGCEYFKDY